MGELLAAAMNLLANLLRVDAERRSHPLTVVGWLLMAAAVVVFIGLLLTR